MNFTDIEDRIKEIFRENFEIYKEDWLKGKYKPENVAQQYFFNRNEMEVERDEEMGITLNDYEDFCRSEYERLMELEKE